MKEKTKRYFGWLFLLLVSSALIILFLPRDKTFAYDFYKGKPWRHEQVTATFDFAVSKSDDAYRQECDAALRGVRPYYNLDVNALNAAGDSLQSCAFAELNMSSGLYRAVRRKLEYVYRCGIIDTKELTRLQKDSTRVIRVIEYNTARNVDVDRLLTVKEAYEEVMNADTSAYGSYLLHNCNLNEFISPNLSYDKAKTEAAQQEAVESIPRSKGVILAGQKIIGPGEIVDADTYQVLLSYRSEWSKRNDQRGGEQALAGSAAMVVLLVVLFVIWLSIYRREYLQNFRQTLFLATQLALFPVGASLLMQAGQNVLLLPFVMVPVLVHVFLDARTAFMTHVVTILITALLVPEPYLFVLLQLTAGLAACFVLVELTERSQLFLASAVVLIVYALVYTAYVMVMENDIRLVDVSHYVLFVISAVLLLFVYPLLYLFEKLFGFTSNVKLVELSNVNGKLLRILSEQAPGTFQHSMQVSNLAAEAARSIGAKSQLVRTGALYHDIGKLEAPTFFTENQSASNPHNDLPFEESARVIIDHVAAGLKLADKHHLPETIKQFIRTHHGQSQAKYFYISYCNAHPGEEVDPAPFTYPGPNPSTAETAILMMADSVEAASRSLPEYTEESISALVDRIVDSQVSAGYFRQCPITFAQIEKVKAVFKEKLRTIYHTRITYPELKK